MWYLEIVFGMFFFFSVFIRYIEDAILKGLKGLKGHVFSVKPMGIGDFSDGFKPPNN
jgi:hypothetical protein